MDDAGIRERFARHDLRWTKQREDVYSALAASHVHPTAEELFGLVGVRPPASADEAGAGGWGTSLATVYNTLEALVRCGLARKFTAAGDDGALAHRYDADMSDHAHVVALDGSIRDLPHDLSRRVVDAIPRDVVEQIEQRLGVPISRMSIEFVQGRLHRPPSPPSPAGR